MVDAPETVEWLYGQNKTVLVDRIARLEREKEELRKERDEARVEHGLVEHNLSNLIARIHRDGGHYEADHGRDKAVEDADHIVANLYVRAETAERQLAERDADLARVRAALEGACEQILDSYRTWVADDTKAHPRPGQIPRYDRARAALAGSGDGWRS